MFSHYNGMKFKISIVEKSWETPNMWKLNKTLIKFLCVQKDPSEGTPKSTFRWTKMNTQHTKIYGMHLKHYLERYLWFKMLLKIR